MHIALDVGDVFRKDVMHSWESKFRQIFQSQLIHIAAEHEVEVSNPAAATVFLWARRATPPMKRQVKGTQNGFRAYSREAILRRTVMQPNAAPVAGNEAPPAGDAAAAGGVAQPQNATERVAPDHTGDGPRLSAEENSTTTNGLLDYSERGDGDCLHQPEDNRRNLILRTVDRYALSFFQLLVIIFAASAFVILLFAWRHMNHCPEGQVGNCTEVAATSVQ
ncbi:hypothetical protein HPB50_013875 [Hyalomma asiaticum]|uniref:Uncharacterized protein n=1 Tax=Hyalomma asiaticum TaxID=266040 RepID=A0ACB7SEX4_HYAAI|nr:hypothetical protein HPB50_013875 [Hyalomma asiaticum]